MTRLNYVFDGTNDNFRELVLANSRKGPVLVNYWTADAGPCFKLWQVLERLSQEYRGRFLLVNVNTEKQRALVHENAITSVPTVKIYHQGEIVESIYGAQSETSLRGAIDKYVEPAPDTPIARAIRHYQAGDPGKALEILIQASLQEPGNAQLHTTTLKLLLREQRYADVEAYVAALPEPLRAQREIIALQVHAKMLQLAQQVPDGVLTSPDQIVIETSKMKIRAGGEIDLGKEILRIDFVPSARKGMGISAGNLAKFVRLGGTLGNPQPVADPKGILKSGATIGATIATGGASLLALEQSLRQQRFRSLRLARVGPRISHRR